MALTPDWVAIKWLLLGWVTVCGQINRFGIDLTNTNVNSAFHPFGTDKLTVGLSE